MNHFKLFKWKMHWNALRFDLKWPNGSKLEHESVNDCEQINIKRPRYDANADHFKWNPSVWNERNEKQTWNKESKGKMLCVCLVQNLIQCTKKLKTITCANAMTKRIVFQRLHWTHCCYFLFLLLYVLCCLFVTFGLDSVTPAVECIWLVICVSNWSGYFIPIIILFWLSLCNRNAMELLNSFHCFIAI